MKNTTILMILDGFGCRSEVEGNAICAAKTPVLDNIFASYPHTTLGASGLDVGLPPGQMGNSEVGHTNIGAGRIVYQELTRITKEIEDGTFHENIVLQDAMENVLKHRSSLHLTGLLSDGGVHSHINHLFAILDMARDYGLDQVYVHCFLDGRDVPPQCAQKYISELEEYMSKAGVGKIATVTGRYYAMDRDSRWERLEKAYDAMTSGTGETAESASAALKNAYARGENDEFVLPTVILDMKLEQYPMPPVATIKSFDSVIMYNFRPDRAREITRSLVDESFSGFNRKDHPLDLYYACMTQYDASMPNVHVAFPPQTLKNTLGQYIASKGMKQLRIAETEKYAHVTFFFNGGTETPYENEERILIPSPKVATYDLQPEMSAYAVTDALIGQLESRTFDFIVLNFANCDMVGHTGVFDAAVKAVEAVDTCVGRILTVALVQKAKILLTSDHGNADMMLDESGNIMTAHSLSPVPLVLITNDMHCELAEGGVLADIAPTLLEIMELEKPAEMTGRSLIK